jgi:hypothetical protein
VFEGGNNMTYIERRKSISVPAVFVYYHGISIIDDNINKINSFIRIPLTSERTRV